MPAAALIHLLALGAALAQTAGGSDGPIDPLQVQPEPPPASPAPEDPPPALSIDLESGVVIDEFGRVVRAEVFVDRVGDLGMADRRDRVRVRSGARSVLTLGVGTVGVVSGLVMSLVGNSEEGLPLSLGGVGLIGVGVVDQLRTQRRLDDPLAWYSVAELDDLSTAWRVREHGPGDAVEQEVMERVGARLYGARALRVVGGLGRFRVVDGLGRRLAVGELAELSGDEVLASQISEGVEDAQNRAGVVAGMGYGSFFSSLFLGPFLGTAWIIADMQGANTRPWEIATWTTVGVGAGGLVMLGVGLPLVATAPKRVGTWSRWYSRSEAARAVGRLNRQTAAELGLSEVPARAARGWTREPVVELELALGPAGVVLSGRF